MKYGVNTTGWTTRVGEAQQPLLAHTREWGFDGVELFLSPEEPADIAAVRRILDDLALERTTWSVPPRDANLVSADPKVRATGIEFVKRCVEGTAELGASLVCGPLYAGLGVMTGRRRTEEEWNWAVEGLRTAAKRGKELGRGGRRGCVQAGPFNKINPRFARNRGKHSSCRSSLSVAGRTLGRYYVTRWQDDHDRVRGDCGV